MKNRPVYLCVLLLATSVLNAQEAAPPTDTAAQKPPMSEKEAAFRQYYKRDPACDSFKDDNMMDRCRHAYMTAKKEFEKIWAEKNSRK